MSVLKTPSAFFERYDDIAKLEELKVIAHQDAKELEPLYAQDSKTFAFVWNFVHNFDWFLNHTDWNVCPAGLFAFEPSLDPITPYEAFLEIVKKFRK